MNMKHFNEIATVTGLSIYPQTGARALPVEVAKLQSAGIVGDRELVLYDAGVPVGENRVSQKECPRLAQLETDYNPLTRATHIQFPAGENVSIDPNPNGPSCQVGEFGDHTPCVDLGDDVAELFADFLQRPTARLARKTNEWLSGGVIAVPNRKVRPLHIVNLASLRELQSRQEGEPTFGAERFRANIEIDTDDPFCELAWIGRRALVGSVEIFICEATKRCPVPGYDQTTGENKKDVPKLYPKLPRPDGVKKPVFGVYAYPTQLFVDPDMAELAVGDKVTVL